MTAEGQQTEARNPGHRRPAALAVTGIGVVSPIGIGREQFWTSLCEGRSGIAPAEKIARVARPPKCAAEVRGFDARDFIATPHLRRMDGLSRMLVAASRMALDDAGVSVTDVAPDRVGVVVGSALGDISESVLHLERAFNKGPGSVSPMMFPNLVLNAPAGYIAMEFSWTGVNYTVCQGETSGEQALIAGCQLVRAGRADLVLAGGGDEFGGIVFDAYRRARALSSQCGGPEWSSPYDADRNGVILGEGAAMLVMEPVERARARGARVHAQIDGYATFGVPAGTYDWPARAPDALGPLQRLLGGAEPAAGSRLICGAGNSSRRLDACEIDLFSRLFGEVAGGVWLSSIKGAVGEFGAAGALSAAAACLALGEQAVPPLCHLRVPEGNTALRFAARRRVAQPLEQAVLCGIARGGAGAAIVFRPWPH